MAELKDIKTLARPSIIALAPYSSARNEFSGSAAIFLDANESPFQAPVQAPAISPLNRYPDPLQTQLKQILARERGIETKQIFIGNGSDEVLDLLVRVFCEPGKDAVVVTPPTYGMYEVVARTHQITVREAPLTAVDFSVNVEKVLEAAVGAKIVFLCSPNNPTGNLLSTEAVTRIVEGCNSMVVLDEAYIDFAGDRSFLSERSRYPNLVILQTLSKAWGLAGLRLGMAFGDEALIALLTKVKLPYNVNAVTQELAVRALQRKSLKEEAVTLIVDERERLSRELGALASVKKVYPSQANFLLVAVDDAQKRYDSLLASGIVVRDRSRVQHCLSCLRITVGTPKENDALLAVLRDQPIPDTVGRRARITRSTNETSITVSVDLDGSGKGSFRSGIGFFDHMLDQLARHSGFDIEIDAAGDVDVDEHHTIEDVGIALGEAFLSALKDKRGIERYGFTLPMDEALAQVAIDLSGRAVFQWQGAFKRERVGELPTELVAHFFKSFSDAAKCALHMTLKGENDHHKIEAAFKAFARALRSATRLSGSNELPSTKGLL